MITFEQARAIAEQEIKRISLPEHNAVILDQHTRERPFGWLFIYQSKDYMDTGDDKYLLAGNAPIIVDRCDGSIHLMSTALSVAEMIDRYEKQRTQNC